MKLHVRALALCCLGLVIPCVPLRAQDADVQALKKQVLELQAAFQTLQADHQKQIEVLTSQVQAQQKLIESLQKSSPPPASGQDTAPPPLPKPAGDSSAVSTLFPTTDESVVMAPAAKPADAAAAPAFPTTDDAVVSAPSPSTPAAVTVMGGGGKSYMNISFNGQFSAAASSSSHLGSLEVSDHDPQQTGFNARNLEIALDGAVDPYFEGFTNIVFKLDNHGETEVEAEEAYMQTTSLPWGLQVRGGQFFAPFGRINAQHPHVWDFVDAPRRPVASWGPMACVEWGPRSPG